MKKILVLLMLPLLALASEGKKEVNAIESTLKDQIIYQEDFESYNIGTVGDAVFEAKKLMWFDNSSSTSVVKNHNGSKALSFTVKSNSEYSQMGGIGTTVINNLSLLKLKVPYTFTMDVDLINVPVSSSLFIEVQDNYNGWTGVKILGTKEVVKVADFNTFDVSYTNNTLEFSFMGGRMSNIENSWIKITTHNYTIDSEFIIDNFKIEERVNKRILSNYYDDFEAHAIDSTAPANNVSQIPHVYSTFDSLKIKEHEGNKYLQGDVLNSSGNFVWSKCYFNDLKMLKSDTKYRVSFDFLEHNFDEFYICYNESGTPCVTYSPTAYLYQDTSPYIIGGSFDGTHITFDFMPSTNAGYGQFYNQVALVFKHNADLHFKIDNLKIENLDFLSEKIEVNTSSCKVSYHEGEQLDLKNLQVVLHRLNGDTRLLKQNEYIVDVSNVNINTIGTYEVKVSVVDEYGVTLSKTFNISVDEKPEDPIMGVSVINKPNKTKYLLNESFELDGMVVKVLYLTGSERILDASEYEVSGFDSSTKGKKVITVSYKSFSDMFSIEVFESARESFKNVQTQASLYFEYQEVNNITQNTKTYSEFKNVALTYRYQFDFENYIDILESGLLISDNLLNLQEYETLPSGEKIVNEENASSFVYSVFNIEDLSKQYYVYAYIKTNDGYVLSKGVEYSVKTILAIYLQNQASENYDVLMAFDETI